MELLYFQLSALHQWKHKICALLGIPYAKKDQYSNKTIQMINSEVKSLYITMPLMYTLKAFNILSFGLHYWLKAAITHRAIFIVSTKILNGL